VKKLQATSYELRAQKLVARG